MFKVFKIYMIGAIFIEKCIVKYSSSFMSYRTYKRRIDRCLDDNAITLLTVSRDNKIQ